MKIDSKALALSIGIVFAIVVLILGMWYSLTGFAQGVVDSLQQIYAGLISIRYDINVSAGKNLVSNIPSILMLTVFAFVDGIITGLLIGFFYNLFIPSAKKK